VTLGRRVIRDKEPLNLVNFRFMGAEAYVLLPDEELLARFPHYEVSTSHGATSTSWAGR
jgi:hypothetical protein